MNESYREAIAYSCVRSLDSSPKQIAELFASLGSYFDIWRSLDPPDAESTWQRHEHLFEREGLQVSFETDASYPALLREIASPPKVLFLKGSLAALNAPLKVAIVGTRKMTPYGERVLHHTIPELAKRGIAIVSGLAYGIDALAHRLTLEHGGIAIAVCGTGIDRVYPARHRQLSQQIVDAGGALLSELPLGAPPLRQHFPARNRIISGLSQAVVVIEAQQRSGSLITARFALEQNRDVYAVPGSIFSLAQEGTNAIIAEGAIPLLSVEQLLDRFHLDTSLERVSMEAASFDHPDTQALYELLKTPLHQDVILAQCPWPTSHTQELITELDLKGLIRQNTFLEWERAL